jgi:hypothetical protein
MHDIVALAPRGQASPSLAKDAAEIRRFHKRAVDAVLEIGRRLAECQRFVQQGDRYILAALDNASPEDRTKAVDSIVLEALLAAIPGALWLLIVDRMVDRHRTGVSITTAASDLLAADDPSIPELLRREPHSPVEIGGGAQ